MKEGDRVKFLNETGGGVIARLLDPETVMVRIEDGFEVPAKVNELIPDVSMKPDASIKTEVYKNQKERPEKKIPDASREGKPASVIESDLNEQNIISDQRNSGKVYLAFTHGGNPRNFHIHLINDTDFYIFYSAGLRKMAQHLHKYSGSLEPNTKVVLGDLKITNADEPTIYSVQYIGFKSGYYLPFKPVESIIEIDTQKLIDKQYESENDFFEDPANLFTIERYEVRQKTETTGRSLKLTEKEFIEEKIRTVLPKKTAEKQISHEIMEVDLHIHEIVEDTSGLSEGEMLDIQLRRFEMALETAMHANVKKVVFIHGVGQGKLKFEITKILNKKYPDLKFQDASFKEYGYGATMVLL